MRQDHPLNTPSERRIMRDGWGTGKLSNFRAMRADGRHVDNDRIKDIKRDNPDWQSHADFCKYVSDVETGLVRRPAHRPKLHEVDEPWIAIAIWEYDILSRYLRLLWKRKGLVTWMARNHPEIKDLKMPPSEAAAEIVKHRRSLQISARSLQNRSAEFNSKWGIEKGWRPTGWKQEATNPIDFDPRG